ncbi:MAG: type II secretion system F family protein, partial [Pseudolabrys sp.]
DSGNNMKFSSKNLAAFYYQLGTLVQAGVPIQNALASARKTAPRAMRTTVARLSEIVNDGAPLHEAMGRYGKRFANLDRHGIDVGEHSGALDVGLLSLSAYYESRASARRKLIGGFAFPVALLVATVFIANFAALFLGTRNGKPYTMPDYLWDTMGLLGRLALACWLAEVFVRWSFRVPGLNLVMDRFLRWVPVLGRLRFDYALSQWISFVRLMLTAGVGIVPALEYASRMVESPLIADAYRRAAPMIAGHLEVSQALASTNVFPDELIQFWATGEESGKLDEMLARLARFYEERWRQSLDHVITWLPRIAYALVSCYIVYQILQQFSADLRSYDELLK